MQGRKQDLVLVSKDVCALSSVYNTALLKALGTQQPGDELFVN